MKTKHPTVSAHDLFPPEGTIVNAICELPHRDLPSWSICGRRYVPLGTESGNTGTLMNKPFHRSPCIELDEFFQRIFMLIFSRNVCSVSCLDTVVMKMIVTQSSAFGVLFKTMHPRLLFLIVPSTSSHILCGRHCSFTAI